jgi:CIC family chloride channel protein
VTVTDRLEESLDALETARGAVAVLDSDHHHVVGWLTHQRVLLALHPPRSAAPPSDDAEETPTNGNPPQMA